MGFCAHNSPHPIHSIHILQVASGNVSPTSVGHRWLGKCYLSTCVEIGGKSDAMATPPAICIGPEINSSFYLTHPRHLDHNSGHPSLVENIQSMFSLLFPHALCSDGSFETVTHQKCGTAY